MTNWDNPPSRDEVDRLAEQYTDTRGWDGRPLDDSGRRLYAVRDAGYLGPVDASSGYPVTSGPEVEILRDLHERNERSAHEQVDEDVA